MALLNRRAWLRWRSAPGFGVSEGMALSLFFTIAAYTLRFHEAWDDEAQAWLIARDNSVWQILRWRLHYEGAPGAWHLLLHGFHVLGGTYVGMGWLSIVLATAGMYVWLRWSPFPAVVRFLLPFTFFFQYQYAVIARSYVLFPILTFALCVLFTRRRHVMWFALLAGVLANVSLQGFIGAFALVGLYAFEGRKDLRGRRTVAAALLFGAMAVTAVYCAIPAPDLDFAIGDQVSTGTVHQILVHMIGETPRNAPRPAPDPPITPPKDTWTQPDWHSAPRAWLADLLYPHHPPANPTFLQSAVTNAGPHLLDFADGTVWPLSNSNLLALAFMAAAVLWLRARRKLRMLLPWFALMVSGQALWIAEHHAGLLLVMLVAGLWLAYTTAPAESAPPRIEPVFLPLLTAILALQIGWTIYCVRADVRGSYDPGPETAQWLKDNSKPRMAAFGFATVSIQPWFSRSPFFDVPASWWQWSSNVEVDGIHRQIVASHPDVVVYGLEFAGYGQIRDQWLPLTHISPEEERDLPRDPIVKDLHDHGYRETHRFCGTRFARLSSAYRTCDIIFEPAR